MSETTQSELATDVTIDDVVTAEAEEAPETDPTVREDEGVEEETVETEEEDGTEPEIAEADPEKTFLSPFKATELVNTLLAEAGLKDKKDASKPRVLPAQMLYQYAGKGLLHDGKPEGERKGAFKNDEGKWQVSVAVITAWAENYISREANRAAKKAEQLAKELAGETEAEGKTDSEPVNELVEA
jgi:hypothetical protein